MHVEGWVVMDVDAENEEEAKNNAWDQADCGQLENIDLMEFGKVSEED